MTSCFFGGVLITLALDLLVGMMQKLDCGCCCCCFSKDGKSTDSNDKSRGGKYRRYFFRIRARSGSVQATNALQLEENVFQKAASNGPTVDSPPSFLGSCVNGDHPLHSDGVHHTKNISTSTNHGPSQSLSNGQLQLNCEQQSQFASESDSQQFVGGIIDGGSVSMNSNAPSDGTNNTNSYNMASVNELFSNTSLLRMNAIIPETASMSLAEVEENEGEAEQCGSHVGLEVEVGSDGGEGGDSIVDRGEVS